MFARPTGLEAKVQALAVVAAMVTQASAQRQLDEAVREAGASRQAVIDHYAA